MDIMDVVVNLVRSVASEETISADEALKSIDSIGLVELVVRLEELLRVEIPDEVLSDEMFESTENLCRVLRRLV